jgi:hypothetical protein
MKGAARAHLVNRFLVLLTVAVAPGPALADWHYCFAVSEDARRVLRSGAFQSRAETQVLQRRFDQYLDETRQTHAPAQCPRADTLREALEMRQTGSDYNRSMGRQTVDLDWSPESRSAERPR